MNTFAQMESLCTLSASLSFLIKSISLTRHSNLSLHLVSMKKLLSKLGGTGTLWRSLKCLHTEDVFCLWPSKGWCKCARVKRHTLHHTGCIEKNIQHIDCLELLFFSHVFEGPDVISAKLLLWGLDRLNVSWQCSPMLDPWMVLHYHDLITRSNNVSRLIQNFWVNKLLDSQIHQMRWVFELAKYSPEPIAFLKKVFLVRR